MWTSNENLPKTKVVDLEKLHKFGIQHFFIWAPKNIENFSLPWGPWDFINYRKAPIFISLSVSAAARPYVAGGPRPQRVRGQLDPGGPAEDTWMAPWSLLAPTRVPGHLGIFVLLF